jgi:hypothetical protein
MEISDRGRNLCYEFICLFMLMGIIQKPTLRLYFTTKRVTSTPGFGDVTGDRLELIYKLVQVIA